MKNIIFLLFILFLSACGIDKESPPPLSSTRGTGELDLTFNGNGFLTINNTAGGNGNDEIYALTVDSHDRVIGVGRSFNASGNYDLAVWRLDMNGNLDTSFSGDGKFTHNNAAGGNDDESGYGVVVDANDDIYICGTSLNGSGDYDMVVWKLTSSGNLDSSFNGTGIFVHNNAAGGSLHDQGSGIALDNLGKIVVAGFSDQTPTNRDLAIWKLTTAGVLDTGFDGDGIVTHDGAAGGENDFGEAVAINMANQIFVAGGSESASNSGDMAIWKFSATGNLDTTYNGQGFLTHDNAAGGSGFDAATDLVIDSVGSVYATGYSRNGNGNNDMVIWKTTANGVLDPGFSADGYTHFDVSLVKGGTSNDTGEGIMIDSTGKIVVVGSGRDDFWIWRYSTNGNLDMTFNATGYFSQDSAAGGFAVDSGVAVSKDSLDRFYIGGFSENSAGNFDATFWRFR